jgi:hypothetical protein
LTLHAAGEGPGHQLEDDTTRVVLGINLKIFILRLKLLGINLKFTWLNLKLLGINLEL